MTGLTSRPCERCEAPFEVRFPSKRKRFCSRSCAMKAATATRVVEGAENPNWRGGKTKHPLYDIYMDMIGRCHRPTHQRYMDYGARGITVCEHWRADFWNFVDDMGERPSRHSIDRVDNDGNYEPGNCRWATGAQQRANRRKEKPRKKCPNGHDYTPDNTRISPGGWQECITCSVATKVRQAAASAERKRANRRATRAEGLAARAATASDRAEVNRLEAQSRAETRLAAKGQLGAEFDRLGGNRDALLLLASELGTRPQLLARQLRRRGLQVPDMRHEVSRHSPVVKPSRFSDADRAEMRRLYASGMSQRQVAIAFDTQQAHVGNILRSLGVPMRPSSPRKLTAAQEAEAVHLRFAGLSQREIGRRLRVSQSLVSHLLKDAGAAA